MAKVFILNYYLKIYNHNHNNIGWKKRDGFQVNEILSTKLALQRKYKVKIYLVFKIL